VYLSVIRNILPVSRNVSCGVTSIFLATCTSPLLGIKMFCCDFFSLGGGSVLDGFFCMLLQRKGKHSLISM